MLGHSPAPCVGARLSPKHRRVLRTSPAGRLVSPGCRIGFESHRCRPARFHFHPPNQTRASTPQAVDEIARLKKNLRRAEQKLHKYEKRARTRSSEAASRQLSRNGSAGVDSSDGGGGQRVHRRPPSRESRGFGRQHSESPRGRYRSLKPSGRPTTPNPDNGGLTSQNDADGSGSGSDDDELAQLSMMTLQDNALGVSQLGSPGDWASPGANSPESPNSPGAASGRARSETPVNGQPRWRPQTPRNQAMVAHAGCTPAGKATAHRVLRVLLAMAPLLSLLRGLTARLQDYSKPVTRSIVPCFGARSVPGVFGKKPAFGG